MSKETYQNIFSLNSSIMPPVFVGRPKIIKQLNEAASGVGHSSVFIEGPRGVGKSVILNEFSDQLPKNKFIVIRTTNNADMLKHINNQLAELTSPTIKAITSEFGLTGVAKLSTTYTTTAQSCMTSMLDMLNTLAKKQTVVIIIDEVQSSYSNMEIMAGVYNLAITSGLNLVLIMSGVREDIVDMLRVKGMTFLRRSTQIPVNALGFDGMMNAYLSAFNEKLEINLSEEQARQMTKATRGYAYAFQLLGFEVGKRVRQTVSEQVIDTSIQSMKRLLFSEVYEHLMNHLPDALYAYLIELPLNENIFDTKIADRVLGLSPSAAGNRRKRLLDYGILTRLHNGEYTFTLPFWSEFFEQFVAGNPPFDETDGDLTDFF